MSYTAIDPIVSAWATQHCLNLYTQHQGEEVRSFDVVSPEGRKYQIWIDPPKDQMVAVHVWDYKKKRRDWNQSIDRLHESLEEAIKTVRLWMV